MSAKFFARSIDHDAALMAESYRLRYQVYCVERQFLDDEDYPDKLEMDEFDPHAVHVGVLDRCGVLGGTARVVVNTGIGLPLFRYCELFPEVTALFDAACPIVEISRLAVSRDYSRRVDDPFRRAPAPEGLTDECASASPLQRRRRRNEVFETLIKAIYQAAKRTGATHWVAVTEPSLQRRIVEYGLPFRLAGPATNYAGVVAPYIMTVAEFDRVILDRQLVCLEDFLVGLEPEFQPTLDDQGSGTALVNSGGTLLTT
jgi:N-acyl amino acid synthase of PEP-CTERM/exosortase system